MSPRDWATWSRLEDIKAFSWGEKSKQTANQHQTQHMANHVHLSHPEIPGDLIVHETTRERPLRRMRWTGASVRLLSVGLQGLLDATKQNDHNDHDKVTGRTTPKQDSLPCYHTWYLTRKLLLDISSIQFRSSNHMLPEGLLFSPIAQSVKRWLKPFQATGSCSP